jgi:hypothetical protein
VWEQKKTSFNSWVAKINYIKHLINYIIKWSKLMYAMLIRKKNNSINEKNKLMTIQIDKKMSFEAWWVETIKIILMRFMIMNGYIKNTMN